MECWLFASEWLTWNVKSYECSRRERAKQPPISVSLRPESTRATFLIDNTRMVPKLVLLLIHEALVDNEEAKQVVSRGG